MIEEKKPQRVIKEAKVAELSKKFAGAKSLLLTDYRGLSINEMNVLRKRLSVKGIEYEVVKNTLACLAAKEARQPGLLSFLEGPTAIAFSYQDPLVPVRILSDFAREHEHLRIKGGLFEGEIIDAPKADFLATLPSYGELLSRMAFIVGFPLSNVINVLTANVRNLIFALKAIKELRDKEGGA